MTPWFDDTELSDRAKEVAEALDLTTWHQVAVAVELCVEHNVPVEIRGAEIVRDESLEPLEQRMAVMDEMIKVAW